MKNKKNNKKHRMIISGKPLSPQEYIIRHKIPQERVNWIMHILNKVRNEK